MRKLRKLFFIVPQFDGTFVCYSASWVFRWFWYIKWVSVVGFNVHIAITEQEAKEHIKKLKKEYINALKQCKR